MLSKGSIQRIEVYKVSIVRRTSSVVIRNAGRSQACCVMLEMSNARIHKIARAKATDCEMPVCKCGLCVSAREE